MTFRESSAVVELCGGLLQSPRRLASTESAASGGSSLCAVRSAAEVLGRAPENFMEPFVRRFVFDPLVPEQSHFEGVVA
jgi:hypothetical protein